MSIFKGSVLPGCIKRSRKYIKLPDSTIFNVNYYDAYQAKIIDFAYSLLLVSQSIRIIRKMWINIYVVDLCVKNLLMCCKPQ